MCRDKYGHPVASRGAAAVLFISLVTVFILWALLGPTGSTHIVTERVLGVMMGVGVLFMTAMPVIIMPSSRQDANYDRKIMMGGLCFFVGPILILLAFCVGLAVGILD